MSLGPHLALFRAMPTSVKGILWQCSEDCINSGNKSELAISKINIFIHYAMSLSPIKKNLRKL